MFLYVFTLSKPFELKTFINFRQDFPGGSVGKESACNSGGTGSVTGSGRYPGGENGNHSSILAWKILWTEEPGGQQSMGSEKVRHN